MSELKKSDRVLQDVIEAVESGQLIPTSHALIRMKARNIEISDIKEAV